MIRKMRRRPKERGTPLWRACVPALPWVRRRLKSAKVKCIEYQVGRTSQTAVDVLWVEGITNQALVDQVSQRIADMDIDALLAASDIEEYLVDSRSTVFPQVLFTERPTGFVVA